MGSLINSSNILNSLINSGMRAKKYARLRNNGEHFEFSGGGVALINSRNFGILKLDDVDNVDSLIFKDFSRGYAYGNISDYARYNDVVNFNYYTIPFEEYIKVEHRDSTDYTYIMIYGY